MVQSNTSTSAFVLPFVQSASFLSGTTALSSRKSFRVGHAATLRRVKTSLPVRHDAPHVPCTMNIGNIEDIPLERVPVEGEAMPSHWRRPGVYGVYAEDGTLQYVAAVEDVALAMDTHVRVFRDPSRVHAVRMLVVDRVEDAPLGEMAENWVVSLANNGLDVPPGNTEDAPEWRIEPSTPNVSFSNDIVAPDAESRVDEEIRQILRKHRVVVFVKGTRSMPRCGFSRAVIDILERQVGDDFVCVDCLDSNKNPGLREGIKRFSSWPTIPQLYVNGDFVGGCDIVQGMEANGELVAVLNS